MNRLLMIVCCLAVAGCDSPPTTTRYDTKTGEYITPAAAKDFKLPKMPPKFPRAVPTPIDPALADRARAELAAALASPDEIIRCHAVETVKDVRPAGAEAMVRKALSDPNALVKLAACYATAELKLTDLKQNLSGPLHDVDNLPPGASTTDFVLARQEHVAAICALYACGDTEPARELETLVFDPSPTVQREAVVALGLIGNRSAVPLLQQVQSRAMDAELRVQVAESLWRLGSEEGAKALQVAAMGSGGGGLSCLALLALAEPRDTRFLSVEMSRAGDSPPDGYAEIGLVASRACGMLGSDFGYGVGLRDADSVDPRLRQLAALVFGAIGRPDAQPVLAKLLDDKDASVRIAAAGAILSLGRGSGLDKGER
jgi:hypothetical protein